ncbi:cytochrome c biogenesis protein ResB [Verrucomicrobiaceae bacterium 227]
MKTSPPKTLGQKIFRVLAGFEIAVICLVLLFLLTFFSTLEQQWIGLYATIKKYFDLNSFFVVPRNAHEKIIFLPLPGAYWVMFVLTVNMILGGLIRARKGWKTVGVLISHFAIIFMMIAGGVSSLSKMEGMMVVTEGETSDYAQKFNKPTIEVAKYNDEGMLEEPLIIPASALTPLRPSDTLTANFAEEEFSMEITGFYAASNLFKASNEKAGEEDGKVVDGFFIREAVWDIKNELANMAGCYATVKDSEGKKIQDLILWMGIPAPVSFSYNGSRYAVRIMAEMWPMPFEVELHKSVGKYYPGTRKASWFQSDITKIANEQREDYKIFMNNPMRHGGYTLFQSQWSDQGDKPYSGFAIVSNPSDQWPKYALYAATVGLLIHFVSMLIRYAGGSSRKRQPSDS